MVSMSGWILSIKAILISAGVVALAVGLKFAIPIAVNGIPAMWSMLLSWMEPPYLYIIINGIIITIAASSGFHQSHSEPPAVPTERLISAKTPPVEAFESFPAQLVIHNAVEEVVPEVEDTVVELKPVVVNGSKVDITTEEEEEDILGQTEGKSDDVFVDHSTITYNTVPREIIRSPEMRLESLFPVREKPLVSSRFAHRKPNRSIPEVPGGRALRVAKPKKQETLESTWKMITEGRHVPLTRHLKKSDTWEHHAAPATVDQVPKSVTFKERSNYEAGLARIRKEPSLNQEELNRRVEAFITKFNKDMRMQRQESLKQYMEMINRGV